MIYIGNESDMTIHGVRCQEVAPEVPTTLYMVPII